MKLAEQNSNTIIELDWLAKWNTYSPNSIAIKDGETGRELTYAEFYLQTLRAAAYLKQERKILKGDRVAVLSSNELEYIVLFFALQRLGAILVPVNFRLTEREIAHIVTDSSPKLLLYQQDYKAIAERIQKQCQLAIELFMPTMQNEICFANEIKKYEESCSLLSLAEKLKFNADFDTELMILYTSGTTGSPKGAVLTHKGIYWNSINTSLSLNLTQNETTVIFLPLFHTGGWNVLTTPILHRGGKIILLKKFDAEHILKLSSSEKCSLLFGVPTTMDMMAQRPEFEHIDLSSIRFAIVGGEPMPLELIKTWDRKGISIRQGYGLTEFGPNCFSLKQEDAIRKIGSIGFANFYVKTKILNDEGQLAGPNEVGELLLQGPMAMKEYWNNEKATAETIKNGWLHTGDLVKCDSEGYFYVVGRKKDMYISGGENVYPAEVEQILLKFPGVREAAVIGVPDSKWGEVGRAFIVRADNNITTEMVLQHCLKNLAKYKIPKTFFFLESLPKGESGKIQKKNLPRD